VRAIVDWQLAVHAASPALSKGLTRLLGEALPREERTRLAAAREARVRETIRSLLGPGSRRNVGTVALVIDSCLAALTDKFTVRRAELLSEPALADEIALLLTRYLEA
jgi:hypothetical protein